MKTNSFEVLLKDFVNNRASRIGASVAYDEILQILDKHNTIVLDCDGANLTPSVADEVIGRLAQNLGYSEFKDKIKITNYSESQKSLMNHVIHRRLKK